MEIFGYACGTIYRLYRKSPGFHPKGTGVPIKILKAFEMRVRLQQSHQRPVLWPRKAPLGAAIGLTPCGSAGPKSATRSKKKQKKPPSMGNEASIPVLSYNNNEN